MSAKSHSNGPPAVDDTRCDDSLIPPGCAAAEAAEAAGALVEEAEEEVEDEEDTGENSGERCCPVCTSSEWSRTSVAIPAAAADLTGKDASAQRATRSDPSAVGRSDAH